MDSNVFIIEDETTVMIDSGMGMTEWVTEEVEKLGLDIDILINTHCHVDHIGGNKFFPHAEIYAHELDALDIEKGTQKTLWQFGFQSPLKFPVSTYLKEGDSIQTGNYTLEVIHTPGHTEGSMSLYERDKKILFSGDCVFDMGIGRMDFPTGSRNQMKASLNRLLTFDIDIILSGHGGEGKKDSIRTGLEFYF
jgi:glyoxylase-like metal-dependent hydrolase (beta-lactamase superfamily II)